MLGTVLVAKAWVPDPSLASPAAIAIHDQPDVPRGLHALDLLAKPTGVQGIEGIGDAHVGAFRGGRRGRAGVGPPRRAYFGAIARVACYRANSNPPSTAGSAVRTNDAQMLVLSALAGGSLHGYAVNTRRCG